MNKKEAIIAMLRRIIVQIAIIATSAVLWLVVWFIVDAEIKIQLLSVLSGIFTGALLSLIYVAIEKKYEDKLSEESDNRTKSYFADVNNKIDGIRLPDNCVYCKFYIKSLPNRDKIDFKTYIDNATDRIWILTTNLHFYSEYVSKIEAAVMRNVDVRLLVLKPTSAFVKLRYKEIDFETAEEFFDQMRVSLKEFVKLRNKLKKVKPDCKFEIKTHLHFPSCMIYILDQTLVFNPILPLGRARETAHIIYDMKQQDAKTMAGNFEQTFTECWDDDSENACESYKFDIDALETWEGR